MYVYVVYGYICMLKCVERKRALSAFFPSSSKAVARQHGGKKTEEGTLMCINCSRSDYASECVCAFVRRRVSDECDDCRLCANVTINSLCVLC